MDKSEPLPSFASGSSRSGAAPGLSRARRAAQWSALYAAAILLLPAIYNGFPFIFADTGGYLICPFEGTLELGRSALYGAFLAAAIPLDFWPNVIVQALLCAWVIGLVLRTQGLERPATAIAVAAALCAGTSLPWYADQLMPDVFLPLSVFAIYLVAFTSWKLRTCEIVALLATIAFAIAAHMAIFAVILLLFAFFAVLRAVARHISLRRPRLSLPAAGIIAGTALALVSNYMITGAATFTPGGALFCSRGCCRTDSSRLTSTATAQVRRCRSDLSRCAADEGDDWLWGGSPLVKLGGWRAFAPEADRIIVGSLLQQPVAQVRAAMTDTFVQLVAVATGEGFGADDNGYTDWTLREYAPQTMARFRATAQQRNTIDFRPINILDVAGTCRHLSLFRFSSCCVGGDEPRPRRSGLTCFRRSRQMPRSAQRFQASTTVTNAELYPLPCWRLR